MATRGDTESLMTPKAAEAFAAYVEMGHGRTMRRLAEQMVQQGHYKTATTALRKLAEWSSEYGWQDRISLAITAKTEAALQQAAELDAGSFLKTSEMIAERLYMSSPLNIDMVIKARESVRKPVTKQSLEVTGKDGGALLISFPEREDGPQ